MEATTKVVEYIRRKYPPWRDAEHLRSWVTWHWCHGLLAAVQNQEGALLAVVFVRFIDRPEAYETAYLHQPGGRICYVELAISDDKSALQIAIDQILDRNGVPVFIMHERATRNIGARLRLWQRYGSLLEKTNVKS